jgi:hypothetical protein
MYLSFIPFSRYIFPNKTRFPVSFFGFQSVNPPILVPLPRLPIFLAQAAASQQWELSWGNLRKLAILSGHPILWAAQIMIQ